MTVKKKMQNPAAAPTLESGGGVRPAGCGLGCFEELERWPLTPDKKERIQRRLNELRSEVADQIEDVCGNMDCAWIAAESLLVKMLNHETERSARWPLKEFESNR